MKPSIRTSLLAAGMVAAGGAVAAADQQAPGIAAPANTEPATPAVVAPPPYSLPWQLRPASVGNVVRSDTSVALYRTKNAAGDEFAGSTVASTLLATYKISPSLAPLVRAAIVENSEPGPTLGSATSFVNPVVGLTYGRKVGADFRFAALAAAGLPIGMGGDKKRSMDEVASATFRGIAARSAMDNAMFAVNYFSVIGGADLAYVASKLTVQAEVTLLQLFRARNETIDVDNKRTNLTAGLHAGYFLLPMLSLGGEIRYQRWLSTPAAVTAAPAARDTVTFAVGPRFHFKVSPTTWLRPGISYSRAMDAPLSDAHYHIVQVDVPVAF